MWLKKCMVVNVNLSYGGSRARKRKMRSPKTNECATEQRDQQVIKGKARFHQRARMKVVG